jgi:hypothetical protein
MHDHPARSATCSGVAGSYQLFQRKLAKRAEAMLV